FEVFEVIKEFSKILILSILALDSKVLHEKSNEDKINKKIKGITNLNFTLFLDIINTPFSINNDL
ncbi:MAG: hypothetical protein WH035_06455, partial [Spirochaetota bacterium]